MRWLVVAAALVVGGALVARWLLSADGDHHAARPSAAPSLTPPTATNRAAPVPAPRPTASDPAAIALDRVVARAEAFGGVTTPNGAAGCRTAAKGSDPLDAITSALQAHVPGFTVSDSDEVSGRNQTLCEVDVRARNALGGTVVVSVVSPPLGRGPALEVRQANDRTVVRDVVTFSGRWRVEVGWVAQTGAHLSAAELRALAHDPTLRW